MGNEYPFEGNELLHAMFQLLVETVATQQVITSVFIERMNISEDEKDNILSEINELLPLKKEQVLQSLYISFGKTPDI